MVQKPGTKSRSGPISEPELPALPSNCYRTPLGQGFVSLCRNHYAPPSASAKSRNPSARTREAVSQARLLALQVDKQFADPHEQRAQQRQAMDSLEAYLEGLDSAAG